MSIFPMIQPSARSESSSEELPLYREVAWDYERNIPIFRRGAPVVVTGKEAVKVWIWKALHTARYRYDIYSDYYGSEFESLIGQSYTPQVKEAEAARYLKECLLTNPYISAVKNISAAFAGSSLSVSGTVETLYGEVTIDASI